MGLIPETYQDFYKSLYSRDGVEDDLEGIGEVDFDIEDNNNIFEEAV